MAETCGQVLLGSGLTILSHPLMYIKVLVQVSACVTSVRVIHANDGTGLHVSLSIRDAAG